MCSCKHVLPLFVCCLLLGCAVHFVLCKAFGGGLGCPRIVLRVGAARGCVVV